jgi:hypothetical protein
MKPTSMMSGIALALVTSACVASPPDGATESEAEAPLTGSCVVHKDCSFGTAPGPMTPLELQLGCDGRYRYRSGLGDGGGGSFCPDTPQARLLGLGSWLPPGYCDACITVPAGHIFVYFWLGHEQPLCPSGCSEN